MLGLGNFLRPHLPTHPAPSLLTQDISAWELVGGALAILALLVLASRWIWRRQRARVALAGREPGRLVPYLLSGAAALPAITLWLAWLLGRLTALSPIDRWLVAFAFAWMASPFAALALSAAGEALTRGRRARRPDNPP